MSTYPPADDNTIEQRIAADAADAKRVFDLARAQPFSCNENYRLVYIDKKHERRDDMLTLLKFAETVNATSADVRRWYVNGETCQDRPGVLATFHPLIHKQETGWAWICDTATALAKDLKRWVWVTLGEDRWVRIILGVDPRIDDGDSDDDAKLGPQYDADGEYQNDQWITTFSPTGEEHFVGCS